MKKRGSVSLFLMILPACIGLFTVACSGEKSVVKPNFLFILVDDLGWKDLGCFGSTFYETPNLDQLAAQGIRFTNAYAACPVCSPTRASIMTGKYPARMRTTDWFGAPQPDNVQNHWTKNKPLLPAPYQEDLPLEEKTIAEALKENGYSTFFAGKWHLGHDSVYWPENQGFDINKGGFRAGSPQRQGEANGYFSPYGNPRLEDGPVGEFLPDRLATETVNFIEQNKEKPFFAYLSFYSVHTPLQTREDLEQKYVLKKEKSHLEDEWGTEGDNKVRQAQCLPVYAGMVEAMDLAVGKVLEKLRESGLDENTVVIFMSDNGGLSTAEGHPTSNLPLRAGKGWLYEGGIREPMIVKWPGQTKAGTTCENPVTSTDFYPTILEMAGLPPLPEQHQDGKSMVSLLKGEQGEQRDFFWHYPHYGNQGGSPGSAIREGDWKLIEWFETGRNPELYNLKNDMGETNNVWQDHPDLADSLQQKLDVWRKAVNARFPAPNPAYKPI